ncbi:hypothetical protein TrST_g10870 [Triparma strigata]|uniref:J domain-containing protein n=1 Tax=Triparma strigata TaxID=1606541 RepID=A0A9W7DUE5_9STRA|nr:hypothetical protein TrST_g10870 [Triparma strigata]
MSYLLLLSLLLLLLPSIIIPFTIPSSPPPRTSLNLIKEDFSDKPDTWNPYNFLEIERDATQEQIKIAYRRLSKKYHIDSVRYSSVLPGSCDDLSDVQKRWDDIKTSYEILSSKTQRIRWDRRDLVRKPGEAVGRLLLDGVGAGVGLAARGVFSLSGLVIDKLSEEIPESGFEAAAKPEEREKKQRKGIFEKPKPDKKLVERLKRRTRNR